MGTNYASLVADLFLFCYEREFLFGEVSSSSGYLGWSALFYCGTPCAFHIIIFHENGMT